MLCDQNAVKPFHFANYRLPHRLAYSGTHRCTPLHGHNWTHCLLARWKVLAGLHGADDSI